MKLDLVFVRANMSCDAVLQVAVIVCVSIAWIPSFGLAE